VKSALTIAALLLQIVTAIMEAAKRAGAIDEANRNLFNTLYARLGHAVAADQKIRSRVDTMSDADRDRLFNAVGEGPDEPHKSAS
jgi:hypothetical protein